MINSFCQSPDKKMALIAVAGQNVIDERANHALEKMGEWMKVNSRSIYHCTQAPDDFWVPDNSLLTYNPETNRLYIHLLDYPLQNFLLKGYKDKVKYAQFLHDASEIRITAPRGHWVREEMSANDIYLNLPVKKPDVEIPVIEIFLKD